MVTLAASKPGINSNKKISSQYILYMFVLYVFISKKLMKVDNKLTPEFPKNNFFLN